MITLSSFYKPKTIGALNLLYKSTGSNFNIEKFWDTCTNKKNTLIILKT